MRIAFDLHSDLDSLLCSTGCEELTFVHISLLKVSLWGLLVQTQKSRGIDLIFPLSVAYHVAQVGPKSLGIFSTALVVIDPVERLSGPEIICWFSCWLVGLESCKHKKITKPVRFCESFFI